MSRTRKRGYDKRGKLLRMSISTRSVWARERKWARKMTNRKARNRAAQALRTIDDPDELVIDRSPRTEGWITY